MIILQLKSIQDEAALAGISSIIKALDADYGYKIRGHEIHQTRGVMANTTLNERVEMVSRFCTRNELTHLAYHAPILGRGQNIWEETWKDKVRESLALTIEEASRVRKEAGIPSKAIVVFHLTNYLQLHKLPRTIEEKLRLFKDAEREFLEFAGTQPTEGCILAVENVFPRHDGDYASIGPFHPKELVRMEKHGIKTTLDLAHYQLYSNYLREGTGNVVGDIDRMAYGQAPSWGQCLKILGGSLALLHISDASGYTLKGEGLALGQGEIPLSLLLKLAGSLRTVQGTLELVDGHLDNGRLQLEGAKWLLQNASDVLQE